MKTLTADADADVLVLVADDGSGRVWVVNDGEGKSWYKPGANEGWLPVVNNGPAKLPGAQDVYGNFAEHDLAEFPGYYKTADAGFKDDDGYIYVMSRTDDIINVAGHRLSTGGMEEVLSGHKDVAECAVIGVADALKGEIPCGLCSRRASTGPSSRSSRNASP